MILTGEPAMVIVQTDKRIKRKRRAEVGDYVFY
jgi:hypothetical protein